MNNSQLDEKDNLGIITETANLTRKNAWNVIGKISGIYKIINKTNGKYYVGSSKDIRYRWKKHQYYLNHQKHKNDYLQHAWNKYGENGFEWSVVELLEPNKKILHESENRYLSIAKNEKDKTYNLNFEAQGGELSDYIRKKIIEKRKHQVISEETKRKIAKSLTGRKLSEEIKSKIKQSCKGHQITPEQRVKMIKGLIGKKYPFRKAPAPISEETKEKIRQSLTGPKSPKYDYTVYKFYNLVTKEEFVGTRHEFYNKFQLKNCRGGICDLIQGKRNRKHVKHWIIKK